MRDRTASGDGRQFLSDVVSSTVGLVSGDFLGGGFRDCGQEFAVEAVDAELGLMDVDVDDGVAVRVADPAGSARRPGWCRLGTPSAAP
jgi:hypothetical protein